MTTISITLADDQEKFLEAQVASGHYASISDAVRGAVQLLKEREGALQQEMLWLRREIEIGLEQLRNGEYREISAEEMKQRVRARLAAARGEAS